MKVFKFGGASVKNSDAVKNVARIIKLYSDEKLVIVISAMGKMTNAFEELLTAYFDKTGEISKKLEFIKNFHLEILNDLFKESSHSIFEEVETVFGQIEEILQNEPSDNYDYEYDRLISFGEILSTLITSSYLNYENLKNQWLDAREVVKTDSRYRDARINWKLTSKKIKEKVDFIDQKVYLTQGFIASTKEKIPTTLGREGSDFSAAIFAYCLNAEDVTIWKDVPGVLNADPKWFDDTVKIDKLSYYDAIELAYYGASVIHPKTIKPLQNKKIPLYVKSFVNPEAEGTVVTKSVDGLPVPSFIFKVNQVLVTISPKDFSFIVEENLRDIFQIFSDYNTRINVMQNTAVSFSVSVDYNERTFPELISQLQKKFKVKYNDDMELVTIRHYDRQTIDRVTVSKEIWLEEKTKHNIQIVMRNKLK